MADYTLLPELRREVDVPTDGILSRTVFSSDRVKAVMFGFDTGQELSEHTAGTPAVIEILDGEAEILLGTDRHAGGAGRLDPHAGRHAARDPGEDAADDAPAPAPRPRAADQD